MNIAYVWEYEVKPEFIEDFEKAYGSNGDWVRLFTNADGYLGTEILKDAVNSHRFITIDKWDSEMNREEFLNKYSVQYRELDTRCESYTKNEKMIGVFNSL